MPDKCWFDHEQLEVYVRMLMGLINRNSTREYDKSNPTN